MPWCGDFAFRVPSVPFLVQAQDTLKLLEDIHGQFPRPCRCSNGFGMFLRIFQGISEGFQFLAFQGDQMQCCHHGLGHWVCEHSRARQLLTSI